MSQSDTLYAKPFAHVVDFAFDESVASVFPDMLRRSIPGYEAVISLLGVVAARHAIDQTNIYDLGCSLGAATLAVQHQLGHRPVRYIAVDSSDAMTSRCEDNLANRLSAGSYECRTEDILETSLENASVIVLNFTLQFLRPDQRLAMLRRIYSALVPGGVLILSEKVAGDTKKEDDALSDLYYRFKAANGYSELEISQKRNALEQVMKLDSLETHQQRLGDAGFAESTVWFRCFNFASLISVKA